LAFEVRNCPQRFLAQPYFGLIEDGEGIALAAAMAPPRKIFLFSNRRECNQAMGILVNDLISGGWQVPGVFAPVEMATLFAQTTQTMSGRTYREGMLSRLYELRKVIPPKQVAGGLRLAEMGDLSLVTGWLISFWDEVMGNIGPEEALQEAEQRIKKQEIHLWIDNARPVSMAAKSRPSTNGISIRLVFTPPEFRGHGYASAGVAALSQYCLDTGRKFCCLFTDVGNPTTNDIYQQIGYLPVTDFCEMTFLPTE
jgi:hypothetical protein